MNKKATEKNNVLTIGELAEVSGTRLTTLKYYTELGILPFNQGGERLLSTLIILLVEDKVHIYFYYKERGNNLKK